MPLFLPSLGFTEILAISVLVIVLFGAKRLPQIGAGLGKGIRNFKDSVTGKDEKKLEKTKPKTLHDEQSITLEGFEPDLDDHALFHVAVRAHCSIYGR